VGRTVAVHPAAADGAGVGVSGGGSAVVGIGVADGRLTAALVDVAGAVAEGAGLAAGWQPPSAIATSRMAVKASPNLCLVT